ncbi:MAG: hypothetical protein SGI92_18185 [Bryobacteraceae bacterium]|nr:hypothetical protein [Bryobacteraceae bacterium]
MDIHVRNLGILAMVFGILSALVAFCLMAWFNGPTGLFNAAEDLGLGFVAVGLTFGHLFMGFPLAIIGFFVMRYHDWARAVMIVLCGINLLNPPVGSLLAIYGLWVLMTPETEPLFTDPPRNRRTVRPPVAQMPE